MPNPLIKSIWIKNRYMEGFIGRILILIVIVSYIMSKQVKILLFPSCYFYSVFMS